MKITLLMFSLAIAVFSAAQADVTMVDDLIVNSDRSNCKCCPEPCCCKCAEKGVKPPKPEKCQLMDLVIVMDSSLSITRDNYDTQKNATRDLVAKFEIGHDKVRVGMVIFSTTVEPQWFLNSANTADLASLQGSIQTLPWLKGHTYTADAINVTVNTMLLAANGNRENVQNVVFFLTDGRSTQSDAELQALIPSLHAAARVYVVGIGERTDPVELALIASDPDNEHVFTVDLFEQLESKLLEIADVLCPEDDTPPVVNKQCICCCPKPHPFGGFNQGHYGGHSGGIYGGGYYGHSGGCSCGQ